MNRSGFLFISIFLIIFHSTKGQNSSTQPLVSGWERIYIKDMGSFDIPPTMEIQKGNYREYLDHINKVKGFDVNHITAQQKGLNEMSNSGFQKYARIIFETSIGKAGDYGDLNFDISQVSEADLDEVNHFFKTQIIESLSLIGNKLIKWNPVKFKKINNMTCINLSYIRQLKDGPHVMVEIYNFHNNDRIHTLTLSYRIEESDYWKKDFETTLKSLKINNIR